MTLCNVIPGRPSRSRWRIPRSGRCHDGLVVIGMVGVGHWTVESTVLHGEGWRHGMGGCQRSRRNRSRKRGRRVVRLRFLLRWWLLLGLLLRVNGSWGMCPAIVSSRLNRRHALYSVLLLLGRHTRTNAKEVEIILFRRGAWGVIFFALIRCMNLSTEFGSIFSFSFSQLFCDHSLAHDPHNPSTQILFFFLVHIFWQINIKLLSFNAVYTQKSTLTLFCTLTSVTLLIRIPGYFLWRLSI